MFQRCNDINSQLTLSQLFLHLQDPSKFAAVAAAPAAAAGSGAAPAAEEEEKKEEPAEESDDDMGFSLFD